MIWFTADTHFGHAGIIRLCHRPFASVGDMDRELIRRWNDRVGANDLVFHLGDFAWHDANTYRAKLNGRIFPLRGNHDNRPGRILIGDELQGLVDVEMAYPSASEPPFFLSHYPHRVWPGMHKGVRHLYGHVHGEIKNNVPGSMDVGVDACNYAPISADEVIALVPQPTLANLQAECSR